MFGKLLASITKPQAPKINVNNDFMEAIKNIEATREKVDTNDKYDELISKAVNIVKKFCTTKNAHDLADAMDFLISATEIKKNRVEAYFYLASISYTLDDLELAIKYLKIASLINPDFPRIDSLRERITNSITIGAM